MALVLALAFSAAAWGLRASRPPAGERLVRLPWGSSGPHLLDGFLLGAWCSPPTSTTDPRTWLSFSHAYLGYAIRPLEDDNDRRKNLATLALLDSMKSDPYGTGLMIFVRDDAVHPDEATRPGWRSRVREVVAAYRGHRALAGYFLADEPAPSDFDRVAEVARAFREADPVHPVYVNLLPLSSSATVGEQRRWREDAARLIRKGGLDLFSFDAYPLRRTGEEASFLLTLANAHRVSRETGCPFVAVLQFTGFGPLDPPNLAGLRYLAAEAIAYGARGIIWFTYWTPNPREADMAWRGGAAEYDGSVSARADTMRVAGSWARLLFENFRVDRRAVAHFGGDRPRGTMITNDRIPGLREVQGAPVTVASSEPGPGGVRTWLVINRDRERRRIATLLLDPSIGAQWITELADSNRVRGRKPDWGSSAVELALGPGDAAVVHLGSR